MKRDERPAIAYTRLPQHLIRPGADVELGDASAPTNSAAADATEDAPRPSWTTNPMRVSQIAIAWCVLLVLTYYLCGGTNSDNGYILWNFGPNEELMFIGLRINTWLRWCAFNVLVLIDSVVNVVVLEVVLTWLTLEIYDRSKLEIFWGPERVTPRTAVLVGLAFNVYSSIHWLFWLYLALTQADTQLIIIVTNATCTVLVVRTYMRDKAAARAAAQRVATAKKLDGDRPRVQTVLSTHVLPPPENNPVFAIQMK